MDADDCPGQVETVPLGRPDEVRFLQAACAAKAMAAYRPASQRHFLDRLVGL